METRWKLDKRVNVSMLVQLVTLTGLMVGSWVNLQRQLDVLSRDVRQVLMTQEKFCEKLERISDTVVAHEYRLREIEKKEAPQD